MIKITTNGMEAEVTFSRAHPEVRPQRHHLFVRGGHLGSNNRILINKREENVDYIARNLFLKYLHALERSQLTPAERAHFDGTGLVRVNKPARYIRPPEVQALLDEMKPKPEWGSIPPAAADTHVFTLAPSEPLEVGWIDDVDDDDDPPNDPPEEESV